MTFPIRFGVAFFLPTWIDLELAVHAESLGFDGLWIGEHIAFHIPTFDAVTAMAAVAARTTRIDIGIAAMLLPLRPAAAVAKAVATLDVISQGRVRLGVGVGGEFPKEFEAVGVPLQTRGARTDEAIAILRALWGPGATTYHGRFVQFEDVLMEPKPMQVGGPPILVGGRSAHAIRRAARLGDGFMPYLYTPAQYANAYRQLTEETLKAGRDTATLYAPMYQFMYVADTEAEAQTIMAERLEAVYRQPFDRLVGKYCTAGTPDICRANLQAYVDVGLREFILTPPVANPDEFRRQLDVYMGEILPGLRV